MTKRKAIPYAAGQLIDDALMAISEALRTLKPILSGQEMTTTEIYRRTGLAIHYLHETTEYLREIKGDQS